MNDILNKKWLNSVANENLFVSIIWKTDSDMVFVAIGLTIATMLTETTTTKTITYSVLRNPLTFYSLLQTN